MHAQTRVASTTVTNRSLQFLPTAPVFVLGYGTVQTYFTTYDGRSGFSYYDRVSGGILLGGEVRPRAGALGVYEADYGTYSLVGILLDTGSFAFQIPTTDSDGNGLPDVVQLDKSGNYAIGGSGFSDNGTPFSASGSLVRSAGSSTGTYRVNIVSATGLTNVNYSGAINLLVFSGSVSYQRGATNSMAVNLRFSLDPANTVTATINFTVVNGDRIDVPQFTAISSGGSRVTFFAGSLTRQGNAYRGDFQAVDGNPATSWPDYLNCRWEITDTNDADRNGIPDLSDVVSVSPVITTVPTSQTAGVGSNATFSVSATGTAPLNYQWRKDGTAIAGATNASLSLNNVQVGDAGTYAVVVTNSVGSVTSAGATLSVNAIAIVPTIATQPTSQSVTAGGSITLSVSANGTSPLSYQWRKDGAAIGGATNATLPLSNVQSATAGSYTVVLSNSAGSVTSNAAILTVSPAAIAPSITTQPTGSIVTAGAGVSLTVVANGTAPLTYQWRKDGTAVAGATNASLTLNNVQVGDAGTYAVVVANSAGSVISTNATLTVIPLGPTARLSNLSVRTTMATGQTLIVGMVVSGGPRNVLVRAVGPALAAFGLSTAMTDPRLELYNGSTQVFANEDWPANLADTFASVGAFGLPNGGRDAAFVQSIDGARSIFARGTGPGVVLVEAYDTGSGNTPRMVNVSARNQVGTGDDILIAGFNIAGTGTKQLLIRAVGPKLGTFGVSGFLVDPKLEVYSASGNKLTENDNWTPTLSSTFSAVGAFALDSNSRDAALLMTLTPGSYTVQVRGADGGTGEALIEIYEVP